ncbi:unnamed protein product [Schistosoma mattheei]|uniref:PDEase domain-containing protein n=1 Tax=Schistosoma mattheei TaxID=31246 RepID=A0A3P8CHV8_9TREM|nr:unnamed protein product [Schistosoma mattheei]
MENHHLAIAFSLLSQPGHDVFENFPRKQRLSSRRMIIDMVSYKCTISIIIVIIIVMLK